MNRTYKTNNEIAKELKISPSMASTTYAKGFKKLLIKCHDLLKSRGLEMSYIEIIILFVKFGWITEHDIPKKIMESLKTNSSIS